MAPVPGSSEGSASYAGTFAIDLDFKSGQLVGTTPLYDREGIYTVRQFVTYEKELRPADEKPDCLDDSAETLSGSKHHGRATVYGAGNPQALEEVGSVAAVRHATLITMARCS